MSEGRKLEAQGLLEKAMTAYASERDWEGAVRLAMSLNRHLEAARYCLQAQRPWDAAVCFQRGGAQKECLAALLHVTPTSARYRDACVHAIRVAQTLGTSLDSMSSHFMPFISYAPSSPGEAEAMKELAESFAKNDKLRLAVSIYRSVLQAFPKDNEAADRLAALSALAPPASSGSGVSGKSPATPVPAMPSGPPLTSTVSGLVRALKPKLNELLVTKGLVSQVQLDRLMREQPEVGGSEAMLSEALVAGALVKDVDIIRTLSESCGIGWISDEDLIANATPEAAKALTQELAERWKVAPIKLVDRQLHLAMPDPRDMGFVDKLRFSTGMKIVGVFATPTGIRRTIGKLFHGEDPDRSDVSSWHGQLLDPMSGGMPLEPFSDRYTGTREHQFDTGEFERPANLPSPPKKKGVTIDVPKAPQVGSRFAGRYQLEALIGEGGSASVYRAVDMELNEPVAIKLFSPATSAEADTMVARFKLELSLSRSLAHPNIIRLFDLGLQGEWRYLTMELLHGKDLASLMEERGAPFEISEGLRYLEQVCAGLHLAHERGVVHRDIKPHNLFVTTNGEVKVMDFGIARKLNSPGVTVVGTIAGTPEYMSPEQINGFSDVTHATDLYALGVTAYQMFTDSLPFAQTELTRLLIAQATEAPPPPRSRNPAIPPDLELVLLKLLEKKPEDRFSSAGELGATLRGIRASVVRG